MIHGVQDKLNIYIKKVVDDSLAGADGRIRINDLVKEEPHFFDRLTAGEKELKGIASVDYDRWVEAPDDEAAPAAESVDYESASLVSPPGPASISRSSRRMRCGNSAAPKRAAMCFSRLRLTSVRSCAEKTSGTRSFVVERLQNESEIESASSLRSQWNQP